MSNATDHLALARDYIAIAESADSKHEAYIKAADEIIAAQKDDPTLGAGRIAERVAKSESWVRELVKWRTNPQRVVGAPFGRGNVKLDQQRERYHAKQAMRDPEQRRQVIASLPADVREAVIEESNEAAIADVRAKQAEHDVTPKPPTAGDLMGGERFDPSESWADAHIIRAREKAHALRRQVEKWGLVLGSMTEEQAYDYLQEIERNIAEVRVELQERLRDREQAEV